MELYENMFKRFLRGPVSKKDKKDIVRDMSKLVFDMGFDKLESFGLDPSDVQDYIEPTDRGGKSIESNWHINPVTGKSEFFPHVGYYRDIEYHNDKNFLNGFDVRDASGGNGVKKDSDDSLQGFDYGDIGTDAQFTWGYGELGDKTKPYVWGILLYKGYRESEVWRMNAGDDKDKILDSFQDYLELVKKTMNKQYKK